MRREFIMAFGAAATANMMDHGPGSLSFAFNTECEFLIQLEFELRSFSEVNRHTLTRNVHHVFACRQRKARPAAYDSAGQTAILAEHAGTVCFQSGQLDHAWT